MLNLIRFLLFLCFSTYAFANSEGWNILGPEWDKDHKLDFATIEWEYFMIHDFEGKFTGMVGYVLTNPRSSGGPLGQVVPEGGNVAVGGQFYGDQAMGNYVNFGVDGTVANGRNKNSYFSLPSQEIWASMTENSEDSSLLLKGQTQDFAWNLEVLQTHAELTENTFVGGPFSAATDAKKAGRVPGEIWTVDAIWPKTSVTGWVENRITGERVDVTGKGYRENSWGRYLMPTDGWDFLVFSEDRQEGVSFVVQTYHYSKALDFIDLGFKDNGVLKRLRFSGKNLAYKHKVWKWNDVSRQCIPQDWKLRGEKDGYIFEADVQISERAQWPFLSNQKLGTKIFFIHEQYPQVVGSIRNAETGDIVQEFRGQAGGEFAIHKSLFKIPDWKCQRWGRRFSHNRHLIK